jgi:hypothetical protein
MKNDLIQTGTENRYFLKITAPVANSAVRQIKNILIGLKRSKKKDPILSDAVSKGILDFFEETGYADHKK